MTLPFLRSAIVAATVALSSLAARAQASAEEPRVTHVFLLIGQSNMAGRGKIEPEDQVAPPRVFTWTQDGRWRPATAPIHFDRPAIAGVGPGVAFGRSVAESHPSWTVGLVPSAVGGSSLDEWRPGGKYYSDALARTRAALGAGGRLTAILWHQGESDNNPEKAASYVARFRVMIQQLRSDLGSPEIPVLAGELGRFTAAAQRINPQLALLPATVSRCALATSEGLTDKGDKLHFDSRSARELGRRYADAWSRMMPPPDGGGR
jgi:Carbohydrate esterase, sialic acid-specific acetylesterase